MFKFNYLNHHPSPGFVALFSGRMIQLISNGLLGLFLPIFFLTKFNYNIGYVFLYYLLIDLFYAVFVPWGAQAINTVGLRRSLRISIFFNALVLVCLFFIDYNVLLFSILAVILMTFFRITFWYPYQTDFAKFTEAGDRGKDVSLIWATNSFLSIIMPLVAGVLIASFGFKYVFVLAIIVYLSSYIPFLALPHTEEKFSWGYWETVGRLFKKKHRNLVLANMANGAESAISMIIWPIFIWQLLEGNYFSVGAISSLITLAAVILQLFVGKYADIFSKRKMIHWGSIFYALGWFFKMFVMTSFHIFLVGTYHNFAKIFKDTPFDSLTYDMIAGHGHYVDEFTVLKEMAVNFGKALMMVLAIVIAFNFGISWTFALAAIASLFVNML